MKSTKWELVRYGVKNTVLEKRAIWEGEDYTGPLTQKEHANKTRSNQKAAYSYWELVEAGKYNVGDSLKMKELN